MSIIFANDLPYTEPQLNPLKALGDTIAFSADDWSEGRAMAWVYGIVLGWDDASIDELAAKFRWTPEQIARLRVLHNRYVRLIDFGDHA